MNNYIPLFAALLGATLSATGGFFAVIIRVRVERKEEINFIKICLADELNEICTIVASMKDTYAKSPIIYVIDLNKLIENTTNFNDHRKRIYLIKDEKLRKKVIQFYKNITVSISKSLEEMSSNNPDTDSKILADRYAKILSTMEAQSSTALELKKELELYKYNILSFK